MPPPGNAVADLESANPGFTAGFAAHCPTESRVNCALAYGAMLSECRLGVGRVLISNLWALDGIRRGYPEAGYMLEYLVAYAAAEAPETKLPALSAEDAPAVFRIENQSTTQ